MIKRKEWPLFYFLLFLALLLGVCALLIFFRGSVSAPAQNMEDPGNRLPFTVVLDAGHGGEDGGAIAKNGTCEKDVNLALAMRTAEILRASGVNVILTRETDILLYDRTADYHGRKKVLDLEARRKIAESTPNCLFVSIHCNAYPQEQYRGLQVWYSPNSDLSKPLADEIQALVKNHLQPQNDRKTKAATSSIYLLHHLTCPSVLVECGFLSNAEEAALLGNEEYLQQLAFLLSVAILETNAK